ncbi:MAG: TonB-dependent receptor [Acidobacteria bacterium]|nr:TonB-dependent receptor [Acidobacteriota bacterium]
MPSMIAALSLILLFASTAPGQTDRGTITGTVSDASAAVIPGVRVVATNTQTGTAYETISTETGNYTLTQLPSGIYELAAELPSFRRYVRQGITVLVAQTLRVDVALELGAASDEITVTADASLLRTESADTVHDINTARLNDLPILGIGQAGAGSVGIRNPLASLELMPGTLYSGNNTTRINGTVNNTESIRVDGQEADNAFGPFATQLTQPSVDAIQEVTVQASNFAAEFGQTGSAVVNYTTRSGTNQFHGSVYDNIVNEVLNAGVPFTTTGGKANQRERARRHDWGFNGGGPVRLGKLYDGQNRTFFFANWEQFRETIRFTSLPQTVPTLKMRGGDFSEVLTGRRLGTDPLGRPIMEGTIYDPATTRIVNGQVVRDPFPNNAIPRDRLDPVAVKIQELVPAPTNNALLNNVFPNLNSQRITGVLSFKIDQTLTARSKLSGYYQHTETDSQFIPTTGQADGFPAPITTARGSFTETNLWRLNWDHSLSPTLLLHIGAGFMLQDFKDRAPTLDFNGERELGLKGATLNRNFPQFRGLLTSRGGLKDLGPGGQTRLRTERPTSNASLTWVKNSHTYKFGGEWRLEGFPTTTFSTFATSAAGSFNFSGAETGLPFLQSTTLNGGLVGFPYASFLLGLVDTGDLAAVSRFRFGRQIWSGFAQDTWKVTPTFTLDYGLRYDFATAFEEQFGRQANFAPDLPNPSAGGALGAAIFEGGNVTEGRCGCDFANNYGWAFGPRIGAAWRFMPKTVFRLGYGIVYDQPGDTRICSWKRPMWATAASGGHPPR